MNFLANALMTIALGAMATALLLAGLDAWDKEASADAEMIRAHVEQMVH